MFRALVEPEVVRHQQPQLNWSEIQRVHDTAHRELPPVSLIYSGITDKNRTFFSPTFLRKEFFQCLEKRVKAWHEHGIKVIFHSVGHPRDVQDDSRTAGVDGINPLEPLSGM